MLLGDELPLDPGWRLVENDLHDIHRRVREIDQDARLVREDGTGRLGLARFNSAAGLNPGGAFVLSTWCIDPATRADLTGEPDGRVIQFQRIADGHKITDLKGFTRKRRDALAARRERVKQERREANKPFAQEYAWRRERIDNGRRPRAAITKEIA